MQDVNCSGTHLTLIFTSRWLGRATFGHGSDLPRRTRRRRAEPSALIVESPHVCRNRHPKLQVLQGSSDDDEQPTESLTAFLAKPLSPVLLPPTPAPPYHHPAVHPHITSPHSAQHPSPCVIATSRCHSEILINRRHSTCNGTRAQWLESCEFYCFSFKGYGSVISVFSSRYRPWFLSQSFAQSGYSSKTLQTQSRNVCVVFHLNSDDVLKCFWPQRYKDDVCRRNYNLRLTFMFICGLIYNQT